jgi:hypothetical protein
MCHPGCVKLATGEMFGTGHPRWHNVVHSAAYVEEGYFLGWKPPGNNIDNRALVPLG